MASGRMALAVTLGVPGTASEPNSGSAEVKLRFSGGFFTFLANCGSTGLRLSFHQKSILAETAPEVCSPDPLGPPERLNGSREALGAQLLLAVPLCFT